MGGVEQTTQQQLQIVMKLVESSVVFRSLSSESARAEPRGAAESQLALPKNNKHSAATALVPKH